MSEEKPKSRKGFASMDADRRREAGRKGGAAVPPEKRHFAIREGAAAEAGRRGGLASGVNRKAAKEAKDGEA